MENMDYHKEYEMWCQSPYFDQKTREELISIKNNEPEIQDRFYKKLSFGTGGLRGIIGAGCNRMNIYTVRQATQGLGNYIKKCYGQGKGVAIAYDSRIMSPEFAMEAALCLCANGIKTYLYESLRPTPQLSFTVRRLGCIAGIVITASHNPREYNGYKVYWEDGAQITPPHDAGILQEVGAITSFDMVRTMKKEDACSAGLLQMIGEDMDTAYRNELKKQSIHGSEIKEEAEKIKVVYTPFNGSGNIPVRTVLKEMGFTQVYVVKEQEEADGNFPTLPYPNPEDEHAWEYALSLAKEKKADLVLATDPDADRLGVMVRDARSGEYIRFTGNMSGMLIAYYLLSEKRKMNTMPANPVMVKTIVTTNMAWEIAKEYQVELIEVLTGFKYIGEQIRKMEETHTGHFVFGLEESYGCLAGTYARDKDAPVAVLLLCEAAAYYRKQGLTLWDVMCHMYKKYGYYKEGLTTCTYKGREGAEKITGLMDKFRNNPPTHIGKWKVTAVRDYDKKERYILSENRKEPILLPASNVVYFELEDKGWCCVRPSGTEPKIKYYYGICADSMGRADILLDMLESNLNELSKE